MSQSGARLAGRRVLILTKTEFDDPRDGGALRVSAIVSRLRAEGALVDAVPMTAADGRSQPYRAPSVEPAAWGDVLRVGMAMLSVASVSVARWYSARTVRTVSALLRSHRYDFVLIEYSQLFIYAPLFRNLPIVSDLHNVEYELLLNYSRTSPSRLKRFVARYEAARVKGLERRILRRATRVLAVSDHDAQQLAALNSSVGAAIRVAPNGVADRAFETEKRPSDALEVVFIGHLGWQPNVDAAEWLVSAVWPRVRALDPHARLRIVGRSPRPSLVELDGRDGVTVHGDVPDTMPFLSRARVATAPLLAAGGTRLKILEALATGTPVVATPLGALGLEAVAESGALVIAESAEDFARAVVSVAEAGPAPQQVRATVDAYRWDSALTPLVDDVSDAVLR